MMTSLKVQSFNLQLNHHQLTITEHLIEVKSLTGQEVNTGTLKRTKMILHLSNFQTKSRLWRHVFIADITNIQHI